MFVEHLLWAKHLFFWLNTVNIELSLRYPRVHVKNLGLKYKFLNHYHTHVLKPMVELSTKD